MANHAIRLQTSPRRAALRRGSFAGALALCLAGVAGVNADEPKSATGPAQTSVSAAGPVRILALGDSYTIGESVATEQRWPEQLAAALRERGRDVAPPRIVARTGWTTTDLERAIERSDLAETYDLVTLLIGVNDQFQDFREAQYPERFRGLLERALAFAGGRPERVIVVSIPDYSVTPFAERLEPARIQRALERYNRSNRDAAGRAGIAYVNITPRSREAASDPSLLADDGLHPSGKMYRQWAERVLPLAERALGGDTR